MKHWKLTIMAVALFGAFIVAFTSGCKTAPGWNAIARAADVTRVAVQNAVAVDVLANPQHRQQIKAATDALETAAKAGQMTGGKLAAIVATLPIKADTVRVVSGALLIYDSLSVLWWSADSERAATTIAIAVVDGARAGLVFNPLIVSESSGIRAAAKPVVPQPTKLNTRKL